jgi:hypothetical protein
MENEIEKLLEEQEILGYKVKPWTLGQVAELSPVFEQIVRKAESNKMSLLNLFDEENLQKGILLIAQFIPDILACSLKIKKQEVENFDIVKSTIILVKIISLNAEYLKNSFGLIIQQVQTLKT